MTVRRWPCPNCGEPIPVTALECHFCGKPPRFNPAVEVGSVEYHVIMARIRKRDMGLTPAPGTKTSAATASQQAGPATLGTEAPEPTSTTAEAGPSKGRRPRDQGKGAKCLGDYMAAIDRAETPPSVADLAQRHGCSKATASRAIKSFEDRRRAYSKDDAKRRHGERGG